MTEEENSPRPEIEDRILDPPLSREYCHCLILFHLLRGILVEEPRAAHPSSPPEPHPLSSSPLLLFFIFSFLFVFAALALVLCSSPPRTLTTTYTFFPSSPSPNLFLSLPRLLSSTSPLASFCPSRLCLWLGSILLRLSENPHSLLLNPLPPAVSTILHPIGNSPQITLCGAQFSLCLHLASRCSSFALGPSCLSRLARELPGSHRHGRKCTIHC